MLAGGAYPAMMALGMLKPAPAHAFNLSGSGKGKHVIILGGGLCGMTSAYELSKLGYKCTILEARNRGRQIYCVQRDSSGAGIIREPGSRRFQHRPKFRALIKELRI